MSEFICHEDECGMMRLNIPTVMVTRCAGCRRASDPDGHGSLWCNYMAARVEPDGFCSWAQPRRDS